MKLKNKITAFFKKKVTKDSAANALVKLEELQKKYESLQQEFSALKSTNHYYNYLSNRYQMMAKALQNEVFGPPEWPPSPKKKLTDREIQAFTSNGESVMTFDYKDLRAPKNYALIYTDEEIDHFISKIQKQISIEPGKRDPYQWHIYGSLDGHVSDALQDFSIRGQDVLNIGSMTPWYEAMLIYFNNHPVTVDYNKIILKTKRMSFLSAEEFNNDPRRFNVSFSISSFEHDGLGAYGDPLNPNADLESMNFLKQKVVKNGLLFLAVPIGKDRIDFNHARIYGQKRFPKLIKGWEIIRTYGLTSNLWESGGDNQPLFILKNQ